MTAAADETWGMNIFDETYLLYNENTTTVSTLEYIATTIAHEFSHQVKINNASLITPFLQDHTFLAMPRLTCLAYFLVVWRSSHDEMVERPLAERIFRRLSPIPSHSKILSILGLANIFFFR